MTGPNVLEKNKDQRILGSILLLGLILRLVWFLAQREGGFVLDEAEYVHIAEAIRSGSYVDDGRWLRSPLFPLLLSPFLSPEGGVIGARMVQLLLGMVLIFLIYQVTWKAWQNMQWAWIAALLAALSFPLIVFSHYLMAETLLLVLFCGLILMLMAHIERPAWWRAGIAGMLLGLALLTKPIAIGAIPALLVALWLSEPTLLRKGKAMVVAMALCVIVLIPWTTRNWIVHQRFIPLDTTAGFNLWFGSRLPEQSRTLIEQQMQDAYPNPADRSVAYTRLAMQNAQENPGYTLEQLGSRLRQFWRLQADVLVSGQHGELYLACPRAQSISRAMTSGEAFGQISPACSQRWLNLTADLLDFLLLAGVVVMLVWGKRSVFHTIGYWWIGPLYLLTALTLVQPRLRMPLIPVLIPLAAAGLGQLFVAIQRLLVWMHVCRQEADQRVDRKTIKHICDDIRTIVKTSPVRLWATGVCLLVGIWTIRLVPLITSQGYDLLGMMAWQAGKPKLALEHYRDAAHWYPSRLETLIRAGQVAESIGASDEALSWYDAATHVVYYTPHAHIGSARIFMQQHDRDRATAALRQSLLSFLDREAIGFAAPILPPRTYLEIGREPAYNHGYLLGFYPPDTISASEMITPIRFRWTAEQAAIRFGTQPTPETVLSLRLSANRPEYIPNPKGQFALIGIGAQYQIPLSFAPEWRMYRLLIPPASRGIQLHIQTETFHAGTWTIGDTRDLGVAVDWAKTTHIPE